MSKKNQHGFDEIYVRPSTAVAGELTAYCAKCDFKLSLVVGEGIKLTEFDQIAVKHAQHVTCMDAYDRGVKFGKGGMFHSYQGSLSFTSTPENVSFIKGFEEGLGRPLTLEREFNGVRDIVTVSW
jgi:hypothetical protein